MPEQTGNHTPDEINCLYEITKAIHATMDLQRALYKVLELLSEYLVDNGQLKDINGKVRVFAFHGGNSDGVDHPGFTQYGAGELGNQLFLLWSGLSRNGFRPHIHKRDALALRRGAGQ